MAAATKQAPRRLSDIAAPLQDGETTRELCPFCAGGSTREKSFVISRSGSTAVYICYRASCSVRGRVKYGGVSDTAVSHKPPKMAKVSRYVGTYGELPTTYSMFFKKKFNIQPVMLREFGVKKAGDGRVIFPILSPEGQTRGDNLRVYKELEDVQGEPKSKIFIPEGRAVQSWHRLGYTTAAITKATYNPLEFPNFMQGMLVVVEDQVSAIKASRLVDCVSLLGTNLSSTKIREIADEIAKQKIYEKVVILLDNDAYAKAISMLIRYRAMLPGICIRKLDKDLKDMSYASMVDLFREIWSSEDE